MSLQQQNLKHPAAGWFVNSTRNLAVLESIALAFDHGCKKNLAVPLGSRLQLISIEFISADRFVSGRFIKSSRGAP